MKRLILSLLATTIVVMNTSVVFAATSFWGVNMSTPQNPSTSRNFSVQYTTLSTDASDTIVVVLYQDNNPLGTQTVNAGGSGVFNISLTKDGTYAYKIIATNGGESKATTTKTVEVDTQAPASPSSAQTSFTNNTYKVSFQVPAGNDIVTAKIYASTNPSFAPTNATLVNTLSVSGGKSYDFLHKVTSGAAKLYFIVQMVDKAGNITSVSARPVVVIAPDSTQTARRGGGRVAARKSGIVSDKAATTEAKKQDKPSSAGSWIPFFVVLVAGLLAVSYWWTHQKIEQE